MKSFFQLLLITLIIVLFNSCTEDDPCQGETTTFTAPDGTTRTIEQPCFDDFEPFDGGFNNF